MTTADEHPENSSERLPLGELRPDDRGEDQIREDLEESIGRGEPRPHDPGPPKTVYAPASERVSKPPLPADAKLMADAYRCHYADLAADHFAVVPNGFDPEHRLRGNWLI